MTPADFTLTLCSQVSAMAPAPHPYLLPHVRTRTPTALCSEARFLGLPGVLPTLHTYSLALSLVPAPGLHC